MKPPIVYLDTQDYIRFENEIKKQGTSGTCDYFVSARKAGKVAIGYSETLIFEYITPPNDPMSRENRRFRGALMKSVCGFNAFPFMTDYVEGATFPNDGRWVPRIWGRDLPDHKAIKRDALKEQLVKSQISTNRAMRRKFLKRSHIKSQVLPATELSMANSFKGGKSPIDVLMGVYYKQYLTGKINEVQLTRNLAGWMSDPERFAAIWYDFGERGKPLDEFFADFISDLSKCVDALIDLLLTYPSLRAELIQKRREIEKSARELNLSKEALSGLVGTDRVPSVEKLLSSMLAGIQDPLDGRFEHIKHYALKRAKGVGRVEPNDRGDLLHMIHAYSCDFFRCDKEMCGLFSDFAPFSGRLIRRLDDLPSKIDAWWRDNR